MSPKVRIVDTTQDKAKTTTFPLESNIPQKPSAASDVPIKEKSFSQLFTRYELWHYGIAAIVYIVLGLLLLNAVMNWIVGPLFIVAWMWWVPPLVDKWRGRHK